MAYVYSSIGNRQSSYGDEKIFRKTGSIDTYNQEETPSVYVEEDLVFMGQQNCSCQVYQVTMVGYT